MLAAFLVTRDVPKSPLDYILARSRSEAFRAPIRLGVSRVEESIMDTILAALPKLNRLRNDPEPSPEGWQRDLAGREFPFHLIPFEF